MVYKINKQDLNIFTLGNQTGFTEGKIKKVTFSELMSQASECMLDLSKKVTFSEIMTQASECLLDLSRASCTDQTTDQK
jgi:hypothetical protein